MNNWETTVPSPLLCSGGAREGVAMWGSCFQRDVGKLEQEHGVNVKLGVHVYLLCRFSRVQLFATLWTVASWDFPGKNTAVGCHAPPGDLPDPRIKSSIPASPALQVASLTTEPPGKPPVLIKGFKIMSREEWIEELRTDSEGQGLIGAWYICGPSCAGGIQGPIRVQGLWWWEGLLGKDVTKKDVMAAQDLSWCLGWNWAVHPRSWSEDGRRRTSPGEVQLSGPWTMLWEILWRLLFCSFSAR